HSMYHWDGPGAIPHHDHLLSIAGLDMIQWTPGAGVEPVQHRRWWPLYHKTVDAGKKIILLGSPSLDELAGLKREFGTKLRHFMISVHAKTLEEAHRAVSLLTL
ncbi:MAG: hypothetical protein ABIL09_27465, partial [Gemmatimonadota bacterium]